LARNADDICAAQRLRWRVFAEELGARLPSRRPGIDQDRYDGFCEHLVARDKADGTVVGTCRVLPPEPARRAGGYCSEREFDLARLQPIRGRMVEVGRTCIHAQHRSGAVIGLLWLGLARYMLENGHAYLAGCASMRLVDGGHAAAALYARLRVRHLAPAEHRVDPRRRLPLDGPDMQHAPGFRRR
jgi:putative hemolysin